MKNITRLLWILALAALTVVSLAAQTGHFRQEGIASVYSPLFQGRPTASGEVYNADLYTAAHPTLPFGTVLRVTNMLNNQYVTVVVNDRGPFAPSGIIELSRAAALAIGLTGASSHVLLEQTSAHSHIAPVTAPPPAPVTVHQAQPPVVPPAPPPTVTVVRQVPIPAEPQPNIVNPAPAAPVITQDPVPITHVFSPGPPATLTGATIDPGGTSLYRLRVGSFWDPANAVNVFNRLRSAGLEAFYESHGDIYRVVLPNLRAVDIPAIAQTLGNLGFPEVFIQVEPQTN